MDKWGCPACKKCHCQCHLFCGYHYDPTDEWNREQCQKDGFDQVGLLQHSAAPALGIQDTWLQGALCWLGSTMSIDQLHCGMAWRQGHLQASAFTLQGCHLTGVLLFPVGAPITDI